LERAGVDRSQTYVTNAVKHFKFVQRGKRRIHNKPDAGEITACRWWLLISGTTWGHSMSAPDEPVLPISSNT